MCRDGSHAAELMSLIHSLESTLLYAHVDDTQRDPLQLTLRVTVQLQTSIWAFMIDDVDVAAWTRFNILQLNATNTELLWSTTMQSLTPRASAATATEHISPSSFVQDLGYLRRYRRLHEIPSCDDSVSLLCSSSSSTPE